MSGFPTQNQTTAVAALATEATLAALSAKVNDQGATDLGIIFVGAQAAGTYTDIGGATQNNTILTASYQTQNGDPTTSRPSMVRGFMIFEVQGTLAGGDTLTLSVLGKLVSAAPAAKLIGIASVQTLTVATEHTITEALLNTTYGGMLFACNNVLGLDEARVQCKLGGVPTVGTTITIRAKRIPLT